MQNNTISNPDYTTEYDACSKPFLILFSLLWVQNTILGYIRGFLDNVSLLSSLFDFCFYAAIIICVLQIFSRILNRVKFSNMLFLLFFCGSFLLTYYSNTGNMALKTVFDEKTKVFFGALSFYVIGLCMPVEEEEKEKFHDFLYKISVASLIATFLYTAYYLISGRSFLGIDQMNNAYYNLFIIGYIIWHTIKNSTMFNIFLSIGGVIYIVAMGTRGALLGLAICFVVFFLKYKFKTSVASAYIVLAGLFLLIFLYFFSDSVIEIFMQIFKKLNFNTRIFDFLIESNISDGNGREEIHNVVIDAITKSKGSMHGLLTERQYGYYAHNIVLELIYNYGYYLGATLILIFSSTLIKAVKKVKFSEFNEFFLVIAICIVTKLFLSSSYLLEAYFFFALGYASLLNSSYTEENYVVD